MLTGNTAFACCPSMENQAQHMLVIAEGPDKGKTYPLQAMNCTLGRSADNAVVFDSSRVSRHHAQIRLLPTGAVIEDLGSTNGTWLNGQRLAEPRALSSGDRIRLADYVTLEYVVEDAGRAATVVAEMPGGSTQVMDEPPRYDPPTPPPPIRADYAPYEPPAQPQPAYEPEVAAGHAADLEPDAEAVVPSPRRSGWLYAVIGVLVVLICLCVALAVYLWFAPVTFWERVFDLVGIPMPTGALVFVVVGRWFLF